MEKTKVLVVGDKFSEFSSQHENVITLGELEKAIFDENENFFDSIEIGQGICSHRFHGIQKTIKSGSPFKKTTFLNIEQITDQSNLEHRRAVHKVKNQHILITSPYKNDENHFTCRLAIHDSAELLQDHMTGQHVQGMVLTEAARQMMLSVTELYLLDEKIRNTQYFVLNKVSSYYHHFAFPISTQIDLEILEINKKSKGSINAKVKITFIQSSINVAEVTINYTTYDKNVISKQEKKIASDRVSTLFRSVNNHE